MPKTAPYILKWSAEDACYELRERESGEHCLWTRDEDRWYAWLATHTSFSFESDYGHLTLLKEARPRGEGYWYAYRRRGERVVKKYLGRSARLCVARLEEAARVLESAGPRSLSDPPEAGAAAPREKQQASLLLPKLHPPRLRLSLVPRERLFRQLDAGLESRLTLISAPAGFGKTTLVGAWLAERRTMPVGWVSLDEGDNDPFRFWRYVISACQACAPGVGATSLEQLQRVQRQPFVQNPFEAMLTTFVNELSRLSRRALLVLDDYHLITSPRVHETLADFVEHLPPALHLLILSRNDPALPLARLRVRNELNELRAVDLRFSSEEARVFLERVLSVPLSTEVVEHLQERTEGWVAGLQLASLALRGRATTRDIEQFLVAFSGSQRHLLTYFVTEVLDAQPEPLQMFLLQTCVLDRLSAPLCDAVTGRADSHLLLEELERANLFLEPLDDEQRWYRYHALFAEAMQHEARRRLGADALRAAVHRASLWYEQHDLFVEAVEIALGASEFARVADLIEDRVLRDGRIELHHTFYRWLQQLPEQELHSRPALCFVYAMAILFTHERRAPATRTLLELPLQVAERCWRAEGDRPKLGMVQTIRALVAWWQDDYRASFARAREALKLLPEGDIQWRGMSLLHVGMEEVFMGRLNTARRVVSESCALCEAIGALHPLFAATVLLGNVYVLQGELQQAALLYRQVLARTEGKGKSHDGDRASSLLGLAGLAYEENDLERAEQGARQAEALGRQQGDESLQVHAALLLARIDAARNECERARQMLQEVEARTRTPRFRREILACQVWLALRAGEPAEARRRFTAYEMCNEDRFHREEEQAALLRARLLIAEGAGHEARDLLAGWLPEAREEGRVRSELETLLLLALARQAASERRGAEEALLCALELAYMQDYCRLFLDEGPALASMLRTLLPTLTEEPLRTYARGLLHAFAGRPMPKPQKRALLSPQEQRVLALLAAGRSRPEIAQELVVSVNTVKTQVSSIYRKLNVARRKDACDAARRLHLL